MQYLKKCPFIFRWKTDGTFVKKYVYFFLPDFASDSVSLPRFATPRVCLRIADTPVECSKLGKTRIIADAETD